MTQLSAVSLSISLVFRIVTVMTVAQMMTETGTVTNVVRQTWASYCATRNSSTRISWSVWI